MVGLTVQPYRMVIASVDAVSINLGDIVHLNLLGKHVVVLNSYEIAKDVLEQSKYSDRPHFTMAGELYVPSRLHCSLQAESDWA